MKKLLFIAVAASLTLSGCADSQKSDNKKEKENPKAEAQAKAENQNATAETGAVEGPVIDLTKEYFDARIIDLYSDSPTYLAERPCVIDFYADWCGPCQKMSPIVKSLAAEFAGRVDFYRVNIDNEQELSVNVFGIESIPTFIYISRNGAINTTVGMASTDEMRTSVNRYCFQ